jgi:hypothetical protein
MAASALQGWTAGNHLPQIMHCLHTELVLSHWVWDPDIGGGGDLVGDAVLDERTTAGECHFVAEALRVLLVTAAPYGFGVPSAQVSVAQYAGAGGDGFLSGHPIGGVFQTFCNVYNPVTHALHANLRRWSNHWVTFYNNLNYINQYFDACYDVSYHQLSAMARVDLGPLVSAMRGHMIVGELPSSAAPPGLGGFYRLVAHGSPAAVAGGGLEGPYPSTLFASGTCTLL